MENKINEIQEKIEDLEELSFELHEMLIHKKNKKIIEYMKKLLKELYI